MSANIQPAGVCSKCGGTSVLCKYNRFESAGLSIDSWEHKCPDCGSRMTRAYRSDDADSMPESGETNVCPFCGRQVAPA